MFVYWQDGCFIFYCKPNFPTATNVVTWTWNIQYLECVLCLTVQYHKNKDIQTHSDKDDDADVTNTLNTQNLSFYSNTHIFTKLDPTSCFVSLNEISTFDSKTSDVSSSHTFISFWPPHTHTKLTIHKLSSSLRLNASVYTSQTQVCTQSSAALLCPHSSLRNQDRHSGVNDAVPSSPSPTSSLAPSLHNTQTPFLGRLFDVETPSTFPVNLRDFWA